MRTIPVLVVGGLLLTATAACSDGSDPAGPDVVVTTNILGDIVEQLVGDDATIEVIMPPNADPHELAPSARQAQAMREADVLVVNGLGFEAGLQDTIEAAADDGATVVALTDDVPDLLHLDEEHAEEDGQDPDADHDHDHDHDHEGEDPHVFTDPARMAVAVEALGEHLAERVDGLDSPAYRARVRAYVDELRALDEEIGGLVATVPAERRLLVTNHEVLGYFADRYGFEVVGTVIPSATTLAEPSSGELADLAATVAARRVPAIFAETSAPNRLAEALAAEGTDVVVVELFGESLGAAGSGGATYVEMQRTNAQRIVAALAG